MTEARSADASLQVEAVSRGPILYIRLRGPIDETFNIDDIINAGPGRDVLINAADVTRISSFGVRQWVNGIGRLAQMRNDAAALAAVVERYRQLGGRERRPYAEPWLDELEAAANGE